MDIYAKGHNGQIRFDGQTVTITREGFLARSTQGRSTKNLPIRSIGAVQFKPATGLTNGWIQFSVQGEASVRNNNKGSRTMEASRDENAVIFTKKQLPDFEALSVAITQAVNDAHNSAPAQTAPDLADQLQKLAGLRDSGILTTEEFEAKKADILARL